MITNDTVHKFIEELNKEEMVKKNLYRHTWLSGSSTTVYPIAVYYEAWPTSEVVLQWASDRACNVFINKINKIVEKFKDILKEGFFWKSDGSCPSTITFRLKEKITIN